MKNADDLKKRLKDPEFLKLFSNAKSLDDIVKIAYENGYNITKKDVENYELSDEKLEQVAGGKFDTYIVCPNGKNEMVQIKVNKK